MPYVAGYFLCVLLKQLLFHGFLPGLLLQKVWHGAPSNKTEYPADFQRIYPPEKLTTVLSKGDYFNIRNTSEPTIFSANIRSFSGELSLQIACSFFLVT